MALFTYLGYGVVALFLLIIYYLVTVLAIKNGLNLYMDTLVGQSMTEPTSQEEDEDDVTIEPLMTDEEAVTVLRNMRGAN
jgi:hypothetical protein